jgi:hypothetical protein
MEYFAVQERQDSGWVVVALTTDRQKAHKIKRNCISGHGPSGRYVNQARVIRPHEKVVQAYFLMGNKLWD